MRWVTILSRLADAAPGRNLRRVLDVLDHTQSGHRLGIGHRRDRAPEDGPVGALPTKSNDFVRRADDATDLGREGQEWGELVDEGHRVDGVQGPGLPLLKLG
jgi:hypothetical protein